jgi:rhodanese-related sulfurtransferase
VSAAPKKEKDWLVHCRKGAVSAISCERIVAQRVVELDGAEDAPGSERGDEGR